MNKKSSALTYEGLLDQMRAKQYDHCICLLVLLVTSVKLPHPGAMRPESSSIIQWIACNLAKGIQANSNASNDDDDDANWLAALRRGSSIIT